MQMIEPKLTLPDRWQMFILISVSHYIFSSTNSPEDQFQENLNSTFQVQLHIHIIEIGFHISNVKYV